MSANRRPIRGLFDWGIGHRVSPLVQRVNLLIPLQLNRDVLVQELVDLEPATANLDEELIPFNFDLDPTSTELVDTLLHTQEHDLELSAVGIVIDVLGQRLVDRIALDRDVHSNTSPQLNDVGSEGIDFGFVIPDPREELQGRLVGREALLLKLQDVVGGGLHLSLQFILVGKQRFVLCLKLCVFLHK